MLNMVRADFYRLFRSKSFWITQLVILLLTTLAVQGNAGLQFMVFEESISEMQESVGITGLTAIHFTTSSLSQFYFLPLIVMILGHDFTKQTLKNIITTGISRTKYFYGKLITYATILAAQLLSIYFVGFLLGTLAGGTGTLSQNALNEQIYYLCAQWCFLMALAVLTNIFLYLTKNTAASLIISIFIPLGTFAAYALTKLSWLAFFNFNGALDTLTEGDPTVSLTLMGAVLFVICGSLINCVIFKRQEL